MLGVNIFAENKRKRKLDTTNHKRICALITTDESNMKRYAKTGKTEVRNDSSIAI